MLKKGVSDVMADATAIFPGQGSQKAGMGREVYENSRAGREVFERAASRLGEGFLHLLFSGPEEELSRTENTQPAIFVTSVACFKAFEELTEGKVNFRCMAGHSIGEYSALFCSGALEFDSALELVIERGRLMEEAGKERKGAMAAVLGLPDEAVGEICQEAERETGLVVVLANFNCPGQVVVSGDEEAVRRVCQLAEGRGARKVVPLKVSGAFHSPLMGPARERLSKVIDETPFREPKVPVIPNVTARPTTNPAELREVLKRQLCEGVLWAESIKSMFEMGAKRFVEFGPGRVLCGLVRRISPEAQPLPAGEWEEIERVAETLLGRTS